MWNLHLHTYLQTCVCDMKVEGGFRLRVGTSAQEVGEQARTMDDESEKSVMIYTHVNVMRKPIAM